MTPSLHLFVSLWKPLKHTAGPSLLFARAWLWRLAARSWNKTKKSETKKEREKKSCWEWLKAQLRSHQCLPQPQWKNPSVIWPLHSGLPKFYMMWHIFIPSQWASRPIIELPHGDTTVPLSLAHAAVCQIIVSRRRLDPPWALLPRWCLHACRFPHRKCYFPTIQE